MDKQSQIVIVGAGVFGLSTALELSNRGFQNITVLDRHVPPVPDGSSVDISRIIRFDYGDPVYTAIAKEAFDAWSNSPQFKGIFFPSPFVLTTSTEAGRVYIRKCMDGLDQLSLPYESLESSDNARKHFPVLQGPPNGPGYYGYVNRQAGWADAGRAIAYLRDQCIERGVSFISGPRGTVVGFAKEAKSGKIQAVKTKSGHSVEGDLFVVATGAWTAGLLPTYNSMLSTGQILGFLKLTEAEMQKYQELPIYINFTSGWFCFPPHAASGYLKMAVHGWGYTNSAADEGEATGSLSSSPPLEPRSQRANFSPEDGVQRLRAGLQDILPELASRELERTAVCWYTDTPTGDFVVDYHPDHENLLLATGGSGHAFKFLPVLGRYVADALDGSLPAHLRQKWRVKTEFQNDKGAFALDGSRGGPTRREFSSEEKAKL